MMTLTVGLQELVNHVLSVAATPQYRDKRAIASRWVCSVPCRGPAPNRTVALKEAWNSRPASLPNRGEWLIQSTTYPVMQRSGMIGARGERELVFTILPARGVTVAATLSPRGQQPAISVPIDSGPFCVDQNKMFWDSGEQVWKILFVSLLFSDAPGKRCGQQLR